MEKSTLQQLINQTGEALVQAGASSYYQKVFKTLTKQLLLTPTNKILILSAWISDYSF